MTATYDGERQWSLLCLFGLHSWHQRNGGGGARFRACRRCNRVDDASMGTIGF